MAGKPDNADHGAAAAVDIAAPTCVAMPAWSVPGSHNVGLPRMRWNRAMMSCSVANMAWPMCSLPVTFGGGMEMT